MLSYALLIFELLVKMFLKFSICWAGLYAGWDAKKGLLTANEDILGGSDVHEVYNLIGFREFLLAFSGAALMQRSKTPVAY